MTPKERAAMQQALECAERCESIDGMYSWADTITALREALDHSGEADEMVVGLDRVKPEAIASDPLYQKGFVDGVEEGRNQVAEQAEQDPVAWLVQYKDCHTFVWGRKPEFIVDGVVEPLYAAPVRTKDLTDDEIAEAVGSPLDEVYLADFRAVIAADREKNK